MFYTVNKTFNEHSIFQLELVNQCFMLSVSAMIELSWLRI